MNKMTTSLFGFALAGLVLIGAGCGSPSVSDLDGTWVPNPNSASSEGTEGMEVQFADQKMTFTVKNGDETASFSAPYKETEKGTENEQPQADFAIAFEDFTLMNPDGSQETVTGEDKPFEKVHVKFNDDSTVVTLYEDKVVSDENMELVPKE